MKNITEVFNSLLLARVVDVPVGRRSGGQLAMMLVAAISEGPIHKRFKKKNLARAVGVPVGRCSSRSAFGWSTGNDISGH